MDKVEDSGKGYDRVFSDGQMIATVEPDFVKVGDEVAIKGGSLSVTYGLLTLTLTLTLKDRQFYVELFCTLKFYFNCILWEISLTVSD